MECWLDERMVIIPIPSCVQVLDEPKICKREWHSITVNAGDDCERSMFVVVIGGVTLRDAIKDPTKWSKAKTNYMLKFMSKCLN